LEEIRRAAKEKRNAQRLEEEKARVDPIVMRRREAEARKKNQEKHLLTRIFEDIDTDGGGSLSQDELGHVFGEFFSPDELTEGMELNSDGEVELPAFLSWWKKQTTEMKTDGDGNGGGEDNGAAATHITDTILALLKDKRNVDQALSALFLGAANEEELLTYSGLKRMVENLPQATACLGEEDLSIIFSEMDGPVHSFALVDIHPGLNIFPSLWNEAIEPR